MDTRTARISKSTYARVDKLRRPGQSFAGALDELLAATPPATPSIEAVRAAMEESARWRPASEAIPGAETVEITLYVVGVPCRSEGRKTGPNNWTTPHGSRSDAGILGWRPLGPGPVSK